MRTKIGYRIMTSDGTKKIIVHTSTRQSDIETSFHRLMDQLKSDRRCQVDIHIGHFTLSSKVTSFGTSGRIETKYWIERV